MNKSQENQELGSRDSGTRARRINNKIQGQESGESGTRVRRIRDLDQETQEQEPGESITKFRRIRTGVRSMIYYYFSDNTTSCNCYIIVALAQQLWRVPSL